MSGKYVYISRDENDLLYTGATHGCSCCSNREEGLTVEQIQEHIKDLTDDLKRARRALRYTQKVFKEMENLKKESHE